MNRCAAIVLVLVGATLMLSSEASAWTVAESNTTDGNRTLLQRFILIGKGIDYNVVADDPDGLYPFCVTLQLEERTRHGWRALEKSHECLKTPEQAQRNTTNTHVGWDTFIYPKRRVSEKFQNGKVRAHGFTSLGGDLTYRR